MTHKVAVLNDARQGPIWEMERIESFLVENK